LRDAYYTGRRGMSQAKTSVADQPGRLVNALAWQRPLL